MPTVDSAPVISHAIQLAVAPVFLLTGVASLIGVMANRLARIIDRGRHYEDRWDSLDHDVRETAMSELADLDRRRNLASWAINFCASAALLVCIVIATLFVEVFFGKNMKWFAGALFVCAMAAVIGGLACFLREVYIATHTVRFMADRLRR